MKSIKNLFCILYLLLFSNVVFSQSWPILQTDDPTGYYRISAHFGEVHGGTHFHEGIDVDCNNNNITIRPIENGTVITNQNETMIIGHGALIGTHYPRKTVIHEFTPNPSLTPGSTVTAGVTNLGNVNTSGHLHFEMWHYDGQNENPVNPFSNNVNWTLTLPTGHADNYNPEINDIFVEPLTGLSNGVGSGYEIIATNGGITNFNNNLYSRIHVANTTYSNFSLGTIFNSNVDKLVIFGNIGFILNLRDVGVNTVPTTYSGEGLTVKKVEYFIDRSTTDPPPWGNDPKFVVDFSMLSHAESNQIGQVFHLVFNTLTNTPFINGNNDFIELRSTDETYVTPQTLIDNIQSNGIWCTKANEGTAHIFNTTPGANDIAHVNDEAKYKDGEHNLNCITEDAALQQLELNVPLVLDNFLPYIKQVEITSQNQIYSENWSWDNTGSGQLIFSNNNIGGVANGQSDVIIQITTSEPVQSVELSISDLSIYNVPCTTGSSNNEWQYTVPTQTILNASNGDYIISINGIDLANNLIEGFTHTYNLPASGISHRLDNGTWSPAASPSPDIIHVLSILKGNPLLANFSASTTTISTNEEILYTDYSTPPSNITSWEWVFEGGNPQNYIGQSPPAITYSNSGLYDVSLTIGNNNGDSDSEIKTNYVQVGSFYADFSYNQVTYEPNYEVDFVDHSVGNISSWLWTFGDGSISSLQNPSHKYYSIGSYPVSLTVTAQNGNSEISEQLVDVIDNQNLNISINTNDYPLWDYNYEFYVEVDDPIPSHTHNIIVNFGDGSLPVPVNNYQTITHNYGEPVQLTNFYPFAKVTTKNSFGQTIDVQTVDFMWITLFPSSYVLDISIHPIEHITPGSWVNFTASTTNAVGKVFWTWRINGSTDDINGICSPISSPSCFSEIGNSASNQPYTTDEYYFQGPGTYKIVVWADDLAGKQGYKEFLISVTDELDPCIYVDFVQTECERSVEYSLNTELMLDDLASTIVYACYDPNTGYPYDDIKEIKWEIDGNVTDDFIFEWEGDYGSTNNVFGCFNLNSLDKHIIKLTAFGGYLVYDYNTGRYKVEYYPGMPKSTVSKLFDVVDCNSNISITSQTELDNFHGHIVAGIVNVNPATGTEILIDGYAEINMEAYDELILHHGITISNSSIFVGMHKPCPELDCDCYTTKASEFHNDNSNESSLSIYPNPTNDKFNVSFISSDDVLNSIEVYNTLGEKIHEIQNIFSSTYSIDISGQTPGLYFVKIRSLNQTFNKKVIKL